jgi:hypothetical protein
MAAGYSGTPLPQKLGIKPPQRVAFVGAPREFATALGSLPAGVIVSRQLGSRSKKNPPKLDVIVVFVRRQVELVRALDASRPRMTPACGLWIAWPKKSSGVATDITEDVIRATALPTGLVDNKVCAIDETWSGLRLVIRKQLRP